MTTDDLDLGGDVDRLLSFAVLARYRVPGASVEEAERRVREHLVPVRELYDDVRVEPQEPDGRWACDVRFVVTSVDGEAAVDGVADALQTAGVPADEAWLVEQLP